MDGVTLSYGLRFTCNHKPEKLLIDREGVDPNRTNNLGKTTLHYVGRLGRGNINEASGKRQCRAEPRE